MKYLVWLLTLSHETPCRACTRWPFLYCFFLGLLHTEMADRCRDQVVFHFTADINLHLFYLFIDLTLFYFAAFRYLMSIMNIMSLQHSLPVSMATLVPTFLMSPIPSMSPVHKIWWPSPYRTFFKKQQKFLKMCIWWRMNEHFVKQWPLPVIFGKTFRSQLGMARHPRLIWLWGKVIQYPLSLLNLTPDRWKVMTMLYALFCLACTVFTLCFSVGMDTGGIRAVPYPFATMLQESGRKLRTSPLYTRYESCAAVFGQSLGYERALYFDTIDEGICINYIDRWWLIWPIKLCQWFMHFFNSIPCLSVIFVFFLLSDGWPDTHTWLIWLWGKGILSPLPQYLEKWWQCFLHILLFSTSCIQ